MRLVLWRRLFLRSGRREGQPWAVVGQGERVLEAVPVDPPGDVETVLGLSGEVGQILVFL